MDQRHYNTGCRWVLATQRDIFPFGSFNSFMADNKYFAHWSEIGYKYLLATQI